MTVTRRTVADDLAEIGHGLLRCEELGFILEQIDKASADILEIIEDAEKLARDTDKKDTPL